MGPISTYIVIAIIFIGLVIIMRSETVLVACFLLLALLECPLDYLRAKIIPIICALQDAKTFRVLIAITVFALIVILLSAFGGWYLKNLAQCIAGAITQHSLFP